MTEKTVELTNSYYTKEQIDNKIEILNHLQTVEWTINYTDNTSEIIKLVKYVT